MNPIRLRVWPGLLPYLTVLEAMQEFTVERGPDTEDQCWLLQHPPVFTIGRNGSPEHILDPGPIPVIRSDRGGQVTYHGPGQWVVYTLLDLQRAGLGVRDLTNALEETVIRLLARRGIAAVRRPKAPGVYVGEAKIASLGLRIRRGCCYHGLSLNTAMDLAPFTRIHPCGYPGLPVTQIGDLCPDWTAEEVGKGLLEELAAVFGRPLQKGERA